MNADALERAYEWYTSGPRQRLQPGGTIVLVMTRWSTKDLTGKLLKASSEPKADQWDVIEFPAIMPSGEPVWPEFWKKDELLGVKASLSQLVNGMHSGCKTQHQKKDLNQTRMVAELGIRTNATTSLMSYNLTIPHL